MSADRRLGRIDGMREAIAIMAGEEAKWADKLTRTTRAPTRWAQRIRCQAYKNAQIRIRTALRKIERQVDRDEAEIDAEIKRLGL